jgi:Ca-activated chloride channel family protein
LTRVIAIAAVIALLALISAWRSRRELQRWLRRDPSGARRGARVLLLASAAGLLAWAWIDAAQQPPRFADGGLDVVLAIDVSKSMDTADTPPTRLRRALLLAERLVLAAEGARLGLVLFAGDAFVSLPLTLDRDVHLAYLHALDSDVISHKGSDLSRALRVSASVFDPRSPRPRALVLLSDGEHAGGNLDDVLVELRGAGIHVVAVGFGRTEGDIVPSPRGGPMFDRRGQAIVSRRADPVLERITAATGGRYHRELEDAPSAAALLPAPATLVRDLSAPPAGRLELLLAAVLAALTLELLLQAEPLRLRLRASRTALVGSTALLALVLAGCPASRLQDGDRELARGEAQQALSLYRRTERSQGPTPSTRIRVGNALYVMEEHDRSAAAYLEALRHLRIGDREQRFVASFNLGNTLLIRERHREARDQFWTALLERPDSLEAKFNYEWASERIRPEPELPPPPAQAPEDAPSSGHGEGEASDDRDGGDPGRTRSEARSDRRLPPRAAPMLSEEEAQRWLASIEDQVGAPLRSQVSQELGAGPPRRLGGQTW